MGYSNFTELKDEEKFFILDALVRTKSPILAQEEFNSKHDTKVDGATVLLIAKEHGSDIAAFKQLYSDNFSDIKIAGIRDRLKRLEEIYDAAMELVEVGMDADGNPRTERKYLATALRAVEAADRILAQHEVNKIRKAESSISEGNEHGQSQPTLSVQVVHSKESIDD